MKIFVTGLTGFIGRHLWEHFSPEDEIYILLHTEPNNVFIPKGRNINFLLGDLQSPMRLFAELQQIKPDVCIHLAWWKIPDFHYAICQENLRRSTDLFQWLVEYCGCKKIISTGSCFEYGRRFGLCHESNTLQLNSYFAWAKNSLMNFGMTLAKKYEIDFVWARLFYVYGAGQRAESLIPNIYQRLKSGEPLVVLTPHNEIDLIHVKDVARALIQMMEINGQATILNVGSGTSIPVWKVVEHVEEAMRIEHRASELLRSCNKPDLNTDFWASTALIENILNWEPKITIEEGIHDYIQNTP